MSRDVNRGFIYLVSTVLVLSPASLGCNGSRSRTHTITKPTVIHPDTPIAPDKPADPIALSVFDQPMQRLTVEFKVHRISAKRGTFGKDSPLWKIVTGSLADADTALRLVANGFHVALGRESDRKALLAYLKGLESIQTAVDQVLPDASREVRLELGPCDPRLSLFFYDRQGDLIGREFVNARAGFTWTFEMRSTNLKRIRLRLTPEMEEPPGRPKWEFGPEGVARQVPQERRYRFWDLRFEADIPEEGFLLLAPTPAVYQTPLPARPFFVSSGQRRGSPLEGARESIYIISPIVRSNRPNTVNGNREPS